MLPPLTAIGTAIVQIYGPWVPQPGDAKWDESVWDGGDWVPERAWNDITPQSLHAQVTWGADDNQGAMSIPSAGSWTIRTYDPDRLLDPSNASGPFFKYLLPGGLVRLVFRRDGQPDRPVRLGFIDEVVYDMASQNGAIRGSDAIAAMAKAKLPAGLAHDLDVPMTLRARAQWLLTAASIPYVTVESSTEYDPIVGMPIDTESSVWQQISAMAFDRLYGVSLDSDGVLRFRWFGAKPASKATFGGPSGIPIETIETKVSLEGVYNHFRSFDERMPPAEGQGEQTVEEDINTKSVELYGDLLFDRHRSNPDAGAWCRNLLADRGAGIAQYAIGTIRPQTEAHLDALLGLVMGDRVRIFHDLNPPTIDVVSYVLGGRFEVTPDSGWSAGIATYYRPQDYTPQNQDRYIRVPIVQELTFFVEADGGFTGRAHDMLAYEVIEGMVDGADPGAPNPTDRTQHFLLQSEAIDWGAATRVISGWLRLYKPYHEDARTDGPSHGEAITLVVDKVQEAWSDEESITWPGPATSETEHRGHIDSESRKWIEIDVTVPVLSWSPPAIGGWAENYGLKLRGSAGELNHVPQYAHTVFASHDDRVVENGYIIIRVED